ncbi:MAG: dermonecrotic toxin domain-containing protein, partial [Pseudomonas sp.]
MTLAQDKRKGLALAAEIAAIKGEISQADLQMLHQVVADAAQPPAPVPGWRVLLFKLLKCPVDGALAFEQRNAKGEVQRVLLYLPDAPQRCLYGFDTWSQLNDALAKEVHKKEVDAYLRRRVGLKQLPGLLSTLGKRLKDPSPDLEPTGKVPVTEIFASLATEQVRRFKEDARLMLVPTEDADHAASEKRLEEMKGVGLLLLNVAGLFVPVVGTLLLAQTVVQILSETFEGVRDWSRGHQHEAVEHLLGVAETVAVGAAVSAGVGVVARGFTRSTFVDGLVPVNSEAGSKCLWSEDLAPYVAQDMPEQTQTLDNGLHTDGQRYWWLHGGTFYQVRQVKGRWRLRHPQRDEAYAPLLIFNGERSWRLSFERPLEWQGSALLLSRLWPQAANLEVQRIEQILQVAGIDEDALRGLLVENRSLPVSLRDTLERFDVDARIDRLFTELAQTSTEPDEKAYYTWCLEHIDVSALSATEQRAEVVAQAPRLREALFEHFASQHVQPEDGQAVLQRDFPGLPDAYAAHLLQQADDAQRQRLVEEQRIPLALAEQARSLLRQARLTRVRESLFLTNSYQADTIELAFNLLRKNAKWPDSINLELREGSESGPRLAVLDPQNAVAHVLVWREGGFRLYDTQGYESDLEIDEPAHLPEVLLAVLPASDRARLKWEGAGAAQQVRRDLQRWLPANRQQLERVMGWREVKPWFNPGARLADGRVGYLLSGRGQGRSTAENTLRARIRALYVGFNENEVEDYLNILLQANGSAFDNLLNQEHQYLQLDVALDNWERDVNQQSRPRARRAIAEELRRCWRLQGETVMDAHGHSQGMRLSLVGAAIHELPELPARVDFNHVTDLVLVNLQLQQLPASFLQHFGALRWLNLSSNAFTTLPAGLEHLRDLQALRLNNNRIRMTGLSATLLVSLSRLRTLNLNDNPLGLIGLHFHSISQLCELHMRNCGLQTVPSGLIWCALLEHADLRGHQITSVPEELLQAPRRLRRTLLLEGNALPVAVLERLRAPDPVTIRPYVADLQRGREVWVQSPDLQVQQQRGVSWDRLRAESDSQDFFQLLSELSGT